MWCAPLAVVPLWESWLGKCAVWGLEEGSVCRSVKSMLDAKRVTPGIVEVEDVVFLPDKISQTLRNVCQTTNLISTDTRP